MKILLADSDHDALDLTTYALERRGHEVIPARDATHALAHWREQSIDLCILAEALPPAGGLELCRQIRATSLAPVIVYGRDRDETAILAALEHGADEYLAAPFSLQQLTLRVDALGRRVGAAVASQERPERAGERIRVADLQLNIAAFAAHKNGATLRLTPLEFRILQALAESSGNVVAVNDLMRHRRGGPPCDESTVLKTHVSHIRAKLMDAGGEALAIRAIPRVGYILSAPER
jgi:DNA-binding response OmpR family regulator